MTKEELVSALTTKGVVFDPDATKTVLQSLLDAHPDAPDAPEVAEESEPAPVEDARRARWEAFLASAREQRPDPTIFDAQRERGEFNKIPDTFL